MKEPKFEYEPITEEDLAAIRLYAKEHGRGWKEDLQMDWMYARANQRLHNLRNTHGPSWLVDFKLPKEKK